MAASLFSGPGLMKEALSRLELNTLQLKHHLDSIDTRMERIEPHLDDLTWRFATGEAATEERKRKTGTSDERPARFSSRDEAVADEKRGGAGDCVGAVRTSDETVAGGSRERGWLGRREPTRWWLGRRWLLRLLGSWRTRV